MDRDAAIELAIALAIAAHIATRREPLSVTTRRTFRTHTRLGRFTFLTAWGYLGAWFAAHVLRQDRP